MNHHTPPSRQTILDSLRYCLYNLSTPGRFGAYGLDFMGFLIENDCHLPLFAVMDMIRAFLKPLKNFNLSPVRPWIHEPCFQNRYDHYAEFILWISESSLLKRIGYDFQELVRATGNENMEAEFYKASRFILFEFAIKCPFSQWKQIYSLFTIKTITSNEVTLNSVNSAKALTEEEEGKLLSALGIAEQSEQDSPLLNLPLGQGGIMNTIFAPTMEVFKAGKLNREEQNLTQLAQLPQLIDYKLIDLYLHYYDRFDPSEQLRHKIARLDLISRTAIKRSPNYDCYSDLSTEGAPNATYLSMGFKKFFVKMIEGGRVFIGNDPPIRDQDRIAVRFYLIEDLKSLNEKVDREICVKNKAFRRYSHVNIHKLVSFLICHDLTRYMGMITHTDIKVQFVTYKVNDKPGPVSTKPLSIRSLRRNHTLDSGFIIRNRELHQELLIESGATSPGFCKPDGDFMKHFFQQSDSALKASRGCLQHYDIFFGCGGNIHWRK